MRREQPPEPGISPTLASGITRRASSLTTRKSQDRASSRPPPAATPLMAAITGTSMFSTRSKTSWIWRATARKPRVPISAKPAMPETSSPAAKARPGDDQEPQGLVGGGRFQGLAELPAHGGVPGVELLRPVEGEDPDSVSPVVVDDELLAHGRGSASLVMTTPVATTVPSALRTDTPYSAPSTVSSSPGWTGARRRTSMFSSASTPNWATRTSVILATVRGPWTTVSGRPAALAKSTSKWTGLKSPTASA